MRKIIIIAIILFFAKCSTKNPTEFPELVLQEKMVTLDDSSTTLKTVLEKHKGNKILIDVWASWCADCIKGLPDVNQLQNDFKDVRFVFLSVDKRNTAWKNGVKRFNIKGDHYNLPKGNKKGDFVDFINLWWIPRYIVINEEGKITLFKATKATDKKIREALLQ